MTSLSFWEKISFVVGVLLVVSVSVVPLAVNAQDTNNPTGNGIQNPLGNNVNTLPKFIEKIFSEIIIPIGFSIITLMIIYSGFLFVVARGNPEKLQKAKTALLWTVIGAGVLLGSWAIANVIDETIKQLK